MVRKMTCLECGGGVIINLCTIQYTTCYIIITKYCRKDHTIENGGKEKINPDMKVTFVYEEHLNNYHHFILQGLCFQKIYVWGFYLIFRPKICILPCVQKEWKTSSGSERVNVS